MRTEVDIDNLMSSCELQYAMFNAFKGGIEASQIQERLDGMVDLLLPDMAEAIQAVSPRSANLLLVAVNQMVLNVDQLIEVLVSETAGESLDLGETALHAATGAEMVDLLLKIGAFYVFQNWAFAKVLTSIMEGQAK